MKTRKPKRWQKSSDVCQACGYPRYHHNNKGNAVCDRFVEPKKNNPHLARELNKAKVDSGTCLDCGIKMAPFDEIPIYHHLKKTGQHWQLRCDTTTWKSAKTEHKQLPSLSQKLRETEEVAKKYIMQLAAIKGRIHVPAFNRPDLAMLVQIALKHHEISSSRAREILGSKDTFEDLDVSRICPTDAQLKFQSRAMYKQCKEGSLWRHNKSGKTYRIGMCAFNEDNLVGVVCYYSTKNGMGWVRPFGEFVGRFTPVTQ